MSSAEAFYPLPKGSDTDFASGHPRIGDVLTDGSGGAESGTILFKGGTYVRIMAAANGVFYRFSSDDTDTAVPGDEYLPADQSIIEYLPWDGYFHAVGASAAQYYFIPYQCSSSLEDIK